MVLINRFPGYSYDRLNDLIYLRSVCPILRCAAVKSECRAFEIDNILVNVGDLIVKIFWVKLQLLSVWDYFCTNSGTTHQHGYVLGTLPDNAQHQHTFWTLNDEYKIILWEQKNAYKKVTINATKLSLATCSFQESCIERLTCMGSYRSLQM